MSAKQNETLLTIFLLTYNHQDTIRDTFDGILKQRTKYPFVVKILEDCSTDGTLYICKEYRDKYPHIFTLINQPKNTKGLHCKVALENEINTPYWCIIEGDDYYTNPSFFEKSVNFLENNKEYNLYCGDTIYYDITKNTKNTCIEEQRTSYDKIGHDIYITMCICTQVREYLEMFLILKQTTMIWQARYICIFYGLIKVKAILNTK